MNNIRQRLRPKHQVLILKCYPHFQKTASDVKPNSSELSYLLYYASTRRSKLQKVGAFLEKKTESDVHKGRLGNVHVTLQIVTALVEKCPRDLPLYISTVFYVLEAILKSHDINLIEESLPLFAALCVHYDSATLAADQNTTRQYNAIIQTYASFASRSAPQRSSSRATSAPEAIRYRSAGLQAVKSFVSTNSFAADTGKHLRVVMPVILENLYSDKSKYISILRHRESNNEQYEKEQHYRLRQSISGQRGTDSMETDPSVATGTAADVDQRANEEVGVLALQSLRQIYTADNRQQVRSATNAILGFTLDRLASTPRPQSRMSDNGEHSSWSTELFEMLCRWTPVQDRFVILVTATESLVRSPILEGDLSNQIELTRIIGWLLRSNINFIGLSVMDVLIGLIQHILMLLQLGGQGSSVTPHHQQGIGLPGDEEAIPRFVDGTSDVVMEVVTTPSTPRIQLLDQLHQCVGNLATHVYYSDQIGDMISAILLRLKPSPNSAIPTAAAAVENPTGAAEAIADSANIHEQPNTDGFFSFDTARSLALQAVTNILVVANRQRKDGANAVGRNRVDVSIWDGTQWLLRDSDGRVRKAYVEALLTWLQLEVEKKHLSLVEEDVGRTKSKNKDKDLHSSPVARRAMSNASQRSKVQRHRQSSFLELLHLAIYENALQYAESEPDILLLHLLQVNLIQKLGVNSTRIGLPMIFRLQEDMKAVEHLSAKVNIGSLVYGYFWALTETFDFESSHVGREIHGEISSRSNQRDWLTKIRLPPTPLDRLGSPANAPFRSAVITVKQPADKPLRPFTNRHALVEAIAEGYAQTVTSPPTSPMPSPGGRSFSVPSLFANVNANPNITVRDTLPASVTQQMLRSWTREACLATVMASEKAKAVSIGGGSSHRHYLNVLNNNNSTHNSSSNSPARQGSSAGSSTSNIRIATGTQKGSPTARRQASVGSLQTPVTPSSASRSVVRVADLKRVLDGGYVAPLPLAGPHVGTGVENEGMTEEGADDDSESLVSDDGEGYYAEGDDGSGEEAHVHAIGTAIQVPAPARQEQYPAQAADTRKFSYTPGEDNVPPVPVLPIGLRGQGLSAASASTSQIQNTTHMPTRNVSIASQNLGVPHQQAGGSGAAQRSGSVRSVNTSGTNNWRMSSATAGGGAAPKVDVARLLNGIEEGEQARFGREGKGKGKGVGKSLGPPPY